MSIGWEPDYSCEEAIRATVRWYTENRSWWEPIRSGEFQEYYERVYGDREILNQGKPMS
jgi:dTDP-glucose 4,6-dehydratase